MRRLGRQVCVQQLVLVDRGPGQRTVRLAYEDGSARSARSPLNVP